ncbi:iron-siderophore ABC transporter substrate-binding protein [Microbacterium sp. MPKO10]|uniref:iron-siderophore ABC transporter substrate-binding protein n=1 Tax=Microbacterium sp. MPKO10 TaxID=2989818 RepID=UPI0022362160|nr:iron-siderophore ABC transporter substrate-binding protein [Microbacterium sp. MPKO10]MCW4457231.1 iron-siderophore ABC transporter substrate-binding protein [Microbacterium sp. MPKO10]
MSRRSSTASAVALAALTALALSACGTTSVEASGEGESGAPVSQSCENDKTTTSTDAVTLTDDLDRTVKLDKPAERVAVLEWQQTEDLLSLCVTPVAVADADGYSTWDTAEELPEGVADVGTRQEPNLDAIFAEDPDLVIVEVSSPDDEIVSQLEEYDVPVLATVGADAADPIQKMKDTFSLIADATGRSERADVVLDEFDTALADAKDAVADADLETTDFVYFDGWVQGGNVAIRPFGQGSLFGELGEQLGLTNVWSGDVDPAYGLGQTDVEGLVEVGDAMMFYTGTDDPESDSVVDLLADNQIWTSLPAVERGDTYAFPAGIWTFGGPRSAEQAIDAYVELLTA